MDNTKQLICPRYYMKLQPFSALKGLKQNFTFKDKEQRIKPLGPLAKSMFHPVQLGYE